MTQTCGMDAPKRIVAAEKQSSANVTEVLEGTQAARIRRDSCARVRKQLQVVGYFPLRGF